MAEKQSIKRFIIRDQHGNVEKEDSFSVVGSVNVTVDDNIGEPSAESRYEDGQLEIDFHNIKGTPGEAGNGITDIEIDEQVGDEAANTIIIKTNDNPEGIAFQVRNGSRGNGIASISEQVSEESGGTNTHIITDTDGKTHEFHTKNGMDGAQGPSGDSFQPIEDASGLVLAHTTGQDNTKAMSQKGVTDELNYRIIPTIIITGDPNMIRNYDGSTWVSKTSTKYGYIYPVEPGAWYRWEKGSNSTAMMWLQTDDNNVGDVPSHVEGQTGVVWWGNDSPNIVQAPLDAHYIYFRIRNANTWYTPAAWGKIQSVKEKVGEISEQIKEEIIDTSSLAISSQGIMNTNKWGAMNSGNESLFLPVTPGKTYKLESENGTTEYQACFITGVERVNGEPVNYAGGETEIPLWTAESKYIKAPDDAAFIFMRRRSSYNMVTPLVKEVGELTSRVVELENNNNNNAKKSIKILYIGNSLTQDGVAYLPKLLKEVAADLDFKIYIWYVGGKTLAQHYSYFTNDTPAQIFSVCNNVEKWTNYESIKTMASILQSYEFDIVVLQEYMNYQDTISTEAFENCLTYIRSQYDKPFKVACLLHPPLRSDINTVYQRTVNETKAILKQTEAMSVIDTGASVMLAMQTELDSLGDQGHLSPDGTHTQEGLPCLLQTYVHALWIFRQMGLPYGVSNSKLRITTDVYDSINVPGANLGTGVITGTDEQNTIAQQCAVKAEKIGQAIELQSFSEIE